MIPTWLTVTILLAPLGAAVLTALVRRANVAHALAATVMAGCTGLAIWLASLVDPAQPYHGPHATWLDLGGFTLGVGTYVDGIGAMMTIIVCLLATLVLVYNAWYMHEDKLAARFPWQFCFFVSAMLGIVLSDNLFMSFVCWELVGLGSYLLIGFWSAKPAVADDADYQRNKGIRARGVLEDRLSPSHAQFKAFVMNRVGDAGFLIGIGALIAAGLAAGEREPLTWDALGRFATGAIPGSFLGISGPSLLTLAALGLFCGAVGKSAQFPLHTWLPDAMQGPTTASSIIHAATMVAAGVFLVARCYHLFTPDALLVVGIVGGLTCLLAATIACVQWDLKAVLAYSTVSQLGLMFVGLGAGAEANGLQAGTGHLFAHAMFKCLLFLCAGAVIHAAEGVQDMGRLGGLFRRMPVTAIASLLAVLAIIGTPFTTGFYSKDAVLGAALLQANAVGGLTWLPLILACCGSLLTAFYMVRWWVRIFLGQPRNTEVAVHAHDPDWSASLVLAVLTVFTVWAPWTVHEAGEHASAGHGHALFAGFALIGGLLIYAALSYAKVSQLISCKRKPSWWGRLFPDHSDSCGHGSGIKCAVPCGRKTVAAFAPFLLLLPWAIGFVLDHVFNPHGTDAESAAHFHAMALAIGLMFTGASCALSIYWWLPRLGVDTAGFLARHLRWLHNACAELWWIDRAWDLVFVRGLGAGVGRLTALLDLGSRDRLASLEGAAPYRRRDALSLDGLVDGLGRLCGRIGDSAAAWHDGRVGAYLAIAAIVGAAVLLLGVLW
jgi:NADH-quinone oxidoreductase subunit L